MCGVSPFLVVNATRAGTSCSSAIGDTTAPMSTSRSTQIARGEHRDRRNRFDAFRGLMIAAGLVGIR